MLTKKEIIYTVIEKLNALSDDSNVTEELIASMIDTKRAFLLKQQFSKASWSLPIDIRQEICVDLETVDTIDGYSDAGKTIRTSIALPSRIRIKGRSGPLLVRRLDGRVIPLNVIPIERLPYIGNNKYTAQLTYAALDMDGRLLIYSNDNKFKFLSSIKITDVFESPEEIYELQCDNDADTTEPWDMEYPLEVSMVD